jgi:hypothetical protein
MPTQAEISLNPTSAKGDILTHSSSSRERLAVGSNNQILTARSSATTGLSWETKTGATADYILISSTTVTANATTITISNTPYSAYYDFRILLSVNSMGTAFAGALCLAVSTNPPANPNFGFISSNTTTANAGSRSYSSGGKALIGGSVYTQYMPYYLDVWIRRPNASYSKGFWKQSMGGSPDSNGAIKTGVFVVQGPGFFDSAGSNIMLYDENLIGTFGVGTTLNFYGINRR